MAKLNVDASEFFKKMKMLKANSKEGVEHSLQDVANEILRLSEFEVPHDKGTLQNTGVVEPEAQGYVIGYHTPYAARLHEHPEYRFQKGRKGKYLYDPIRKNSKQLGLKFANKLGGFLK